MLFCLHWKLRVSLSNSSIPNWDLRSRNSRCTMPTPCVLPIMLASHARLFVGLHGPLVCWPPSHPNHFSIRPVAVHTSTLACGVPMIARTLVAIYSMILTNAAFWVRQDCISLVVYCVIFEDCWL